MAKYASKIVEQAKAWLGKNEADGSHKAIIDLYNSHKPLARGYKVKYTDDWCATFVSAVAIKLGYTDIIPTECGCEKMTELFKKLGRWKENDAYKPSPGDIIFYDWQDSGKGDCKGWADHTGIVEKVSGSTITIIEGNINEGVSRRTKKVDDKYIRGYGVPKYDTKPAEEKKPAAEKKTAAFVTGAKIKLKDCPLYVSSGAKSPAAKITGLYYIWSGDVINGRLRITNKKARVGKAGQITGWIDKSNAK